MDDIKNSLNILDLGQVSSKALLETEINNRLSNLKNLTYKSIIFNTYQISGFDNTAYIGLLFRHNEDRAWLLVSSAFSVLKYGVRIQSWSWFNIDKTNN